MNPLFHNYSIVDVQIVYSLLTDLYYIVSFNGTAFKYQYISHKFSQWSGELAGKLEVCEIDGQIFKMDTGWNKNITS